MNITYTFAADCKIKELAGKTVTGGKFSKQFVGGALKDVVQFDTLIAGKPVAALIAGKPELESAFAAYKAAESAAVAERIAKQEAFKKTPEGQRQELLEAEYNYYSPEAYPGSARWHQWNDAVLALEAFDSSHPEIVAKAKADKIAKDAAGYAALSDFVKNGS